MANDSQSWENLDIGTKIGVIGGIIFFILWSIAVVYYMFVPVEDSSPLPY